MKIYTTKLNKYKMLDRLSSDVIAATLENEISYIRMYLEDWEELSSYDNRIEILRPDGKKYISQTLDIISSTEDDIQQKYMEIPITLILCELQGTYHLDLCSTKGDKVFKSLNQITYKVNESINAFDSMEQKDVELIKNVFSADEDTLTLSNKGVFSINSDWVYFNVSEPIQNISDEIDDFEDSINQHIIDNGLTQEQKDKLNSLENYDDTAINKRVDLLNDEIEEHKISVLDHKDIRDSINVLATNLQEHTHTFESLENKPTTLSGYGITDAINSNQLVSLQNEMTPRRLSAFSELPSNSNINTAYIYVDNNGSDNKVSIQNIINKTMRTASYIPEDLQIGSYLFLEKGEK